MPPSLTLPDTAYPGLPLTLSSNYTSGPGTHIHADRIIASISGTPSCSSTNPRTISVTRRTPSLAAPVSRAVVASSTLPTVGSTVLGRVTRLEKDRVSVAIVSVTPPPPPSKSKSEETHAGQDKQASSAAAALNPGTLCAEALRGVIRREDVRGWEVDKVRTGELFAVGDVVRAVVISVGDAGAYYLSTARNELGVLVAKSEEGGVMVPVSWREFRDVRSGRVEGRKVAKPV